MADEVLQATAAPEMLSFFGLSYWLDQVSALLDRVDNAALAKAPTAEETKLTEQKDDLLQAQSSLRRTMGSRLENPELTKRERPLAQDFLRQQIGKLEKGSAVAGPAAEKKAARAIEKLRTILEEVGTKKAQLETREVQDIEASMKVAEAEFKEVSPIFEKWQAGRHTFKTNDDLQAMKRKYENARKTREACPEKLHKALCSSREGKALAVPVVSNAPPKGWFSAGPAKKASAPARAVTATARPARQNAWGSSVMSFAQRLRTQQTQADDDEEEEDADEDADTYRPAAVEAPRPVRVLPKAAPRLPPSIDQDGFKSVKAGSGARPPPPPVPKTAEESEDEEEEAEPSKQQPQQATYNASAKKKGKAGKTKKDKRKEKEEEENDEEPEDCAGPQSQSSKPSASAWAVAVETAFSGSLLQELVQPSIWSLPEDDACAESRLQHLADRLPLSSPLGLVHSLEWKEFFSLEVDGGPRRTSRRGSPEWTTRLHKNLASLLAHYVTILFVTSLLLALADFGLLLWATILQAALLLAPPDVPHLRSPTRVLLLQASHFLLWLLFMRSVWQLHFFVKCFVLLVAGGHSYCVVPLGTDRDD